MQATTSFLDEPLRAVHAAFGPCLWHSALPHFRAEILVPGTAHDGNLDTLSARVNEMFHATFPSMEARNQIPSLVHAHAHFLRPNSLVRVRCMVQDMLDPEYFLGAFETAPSGQLVCGMYQDVLPEGVDINLNSARNITCERQLLYCVPVPAESPWVTQGLAQGQVLDPPSAGVSGPKRTAEDTADDGNAMDSTVTTSAAEDDTPSKRARHQGGASTAAEGLPAANNGDLYHPLSMTGASTCVVKVYLPSHGLKLNDVVEFFGILTFDSGSAVNSAAHDNQPGMATAHDQLQLDWLAGLPSALIPRVHCFSFVRAGLAYPPVPEDLLADQSLVMQTVRSSVGAIRPAVIQYLAAVLGGDQLAAEYVLLNLLSGIYARVDITQLGRFSLNLTGCPRSQTDASAPYASTFGHVLQQAVALIMTKSCLLPLALAFLNNNRLQPSRDVNTNRLQATMLQLSDGTHMVVDETVLDEGKLNATGVNNIKSVQQLLGSQSVTYDIPFQTLEFNVDVPIIVLSEGKSLVQVDCIMPLGARSVPSTVPAVSQEFLDQARTYLAVCRQMPYNITEEMSSLVERDFVAQRQNAAALNQSKMSQLDLYHELTIARLVTLSFGESSLTVDRWQYMRQLETARRARFATVSSAAPADR